MDTFRESGDVFFEREVEAERGTEALGDFILIGEGTVTAGGYSYDFYKMGWPCPRRES